MLELAVVIGRAIPDAPFGKVQDAALMTVIELRRRGLINGERGIGG